MRYTKDVPSRIPVLTTLLFKKHLEEDEKLLRVVHKYWLIGVKSIFWPTIFVVADLALLSINHARGVVIVSAVLGVALIVWWIRNFLDYYLDAWIITDHGIIDVAWYGWFHRQSTRILYSDLEGVSYEIKGVLPTLLRYGTVSVEKISTGSAVELPYVYRPKKVELDILKNMETYLHARNMKDSKQVQELLAALVTEQLHLREMHDSSE